MESRVTIFKDVIISILTEARLESCLPSQHNLNYGFKILLNQGSKKKERQCSIKEIAIQFDGK